MATLPMLSEKHLPHSTNASLVSYCDPHDLVAIVSDSHDIVVYRISGEIAFTIKRKNPDVPVTAIQWKQDGGVLAVGWDDGTYALHAGENGRLLSQSSMRANGKTAAWSLELGGELMNEGEDVTLEVVVGFSFMRHSRRSSTKAQEDPSNLAPQSSASTEDWYDGADDASANGEGEAVANASSISQLTRSIATLDVTTVLPKPSAIPSHGLRLGPEGSKFTSQAATDTVFDTHNEATSDKVDSLLVYGSDGTIQVHTDDTVRLGTCKIAGQPILHTSNPESSSHALFSYELGRPVTNIIFLPLPTLTSPLLHTISLNTKRIQNLLAYITQTIRCIDHDFTAGLQLPNRLITNLNTELKEKQEGDAVTNLYHLAMTGHFTPTMLEWLVDIVKETNHKRWDQALNGVYTNIQNHLFVNLLPALDRLSIATTTLRGYAVQHEGTRKFEVSPTAFTLLLDGVDSLRLVAQKMLLLIMTEHKQFRAFSKWLRVMIEVGVAGPGSKSANETEERDTPNLDVPLLLAYIESTMTKSLLSRHIAPRSMLRGSCSTADNFFETPVVSQMSHERTTEAVRQLDGRGNDSDLALKGVDDADALVNLPALATYLAANVRVALEQVTSWQSRMLIKPASLWLDDGTPWTILDMTMTIDRTPQRSNPTADFWLEVKMLVRPVETQQRLDVFLTRYSASASNESELATGLLPDPMLRLANGEILDAKILTDEHTLILVRHAERGAYGILRLERGKPDTPLLHKWIMESSFRPERLLVGGRAGKKVCVVFGERGWQAFDLEQIISGAGITDNFMMDD